MNKKVLIACVLCLWLGFTLMWIWTGRQGRDQTLVVIFDDFQSFSPRAMGDEPVLVDPKNKSLTFASGHDDIEISFEPKMAGSGYLKVWRSHSTGNSGLYLHLDKNLEVVETNVEFDMSQR